MAPDDGSAATLDMDAITDNIGAQLFGPETTEKPIEEEAAAPTETAVAETKPIEAAPAAQTVKPVPKTWPKEMHDFWPKLDPKLHDYIELREKQMYDGLEQYKGDAAYGKSFREAVTPFEAGLTAAGITPVQAFANLLQAQWRLTQGPEEARRQAYEQLGKDLGFTNAAASTPPAPVDPALKALQEKFTTFESSLRAQQQAVDNAAREKSLKEVEAFASDPAHPYFEEVSADIAGLLSSNLAGTLQEAYDKAVRANPVTWEKEKARLQTEAVEKFKENARLDALPKKKAAGVNLKSRETTAGHEEPVGKLEDTIRGAYRQIRERTA